MLLSARRGGNAEFFAVLGDGAAGDFDAEAFVEAGADVFVGEGVGLVFGVDEGAYAGLDAFGAHLAAVAGGEGAVEEVFEFEHAVGGAHVLVGGDAAYAGFAAAYVFGDVLEHEGFEFVHAVLEEVVLVLHYAFHHLIEGALAFFEAAYDPHGGAQAVVHVVLFLAGAVFFREFFGQGGKLKMGQVFVVHENDEFSVHLAHEDVGAHVAGGAAAEAAAGARFEALNDGQVFLLVLGRQLLLQQQVRKTADTDNGRFEFMGEVVDKI